MNGWYTPAYMNDMFTQWGSFNIQANTAWADSITRPMLGQTSIYNFNNFCQYPNMAGNSYLTNPFFTLGQMSWQNTMNGGMPYFNAQGQFQAPWANGAGMNNWGFMGWTPSGTTSSNSNLTEEERDYKIKYETLLPLVKELSKYDEISYAEQTKLKDATSPTGKTWKEKFEALEKAYKNIDKETRREFILENGYKIGTTKDINGKDDKNSFYNRLLDCGYEFENDDAGVDDQISSIKDSISSISGKNGNTTALENIATGDWDILDIVSSWNTKYASSSDDEKRIMKYIVTKYNDMKNGDSLRETVISTAINPLVDKLIEAADNVKGSVDKTSKARIEDAVSKLRESRKNCDKDNDIASDLYENFDALYLLLRQASITKLRNEVLNYYGEVDSEVFTDDMFATETYEDLKAEGFDDSAIKGAGVTPKKKPTSSGSKTSNEIDNKTALEQVEQLKKDGVIETMQLKTADGKTVYREKEKTGNRDYQRLYYIENDKLVEWTNTRYDDDTTSFVAINNALAQNEVEAKPSKVIEDKEKAEEARQNAVSVQNSRENSKSDGKYIAEKLPGTTDDFIYSNVDTKLRNLNKDNIIDFFDGYYDVRGQGKIEGILELMDDEYDKGQIKIENKKIMINSLLERAVQAGISTSDDDYKAIHELINDKYTSSFEDKNTFNHGGWSRFGKDWAVKLSQGIGALAVGGYAASLAAAASVTAAISNPIGWCVAGGIIIWLLCDKTTDNEVLDKHMKSLYNKIKAKESQRI